MTTNIEDIDPRDILNAPIHGPQTYGTTVGQYLTTIGRNQWYSRFTSSVSRASCNRWTEQLAKSLVDAGLLGERITLLTAIEYDWKDVQASELINAAYDYLAKIDYSTLPDPEPVKDHIVVQTLPNGRRVVANNHLHTLKEAQALKDKWNANYTEQTFFVHKIPNI